MWPTTSDPGVWRTIVVADNADLSRVQSLPCYYFSVSLPYHRSLDWTWSDTDILPIAAIRRTIACCCHPNDNVNERWKMFIFAGTTTLRSPPSTATATTTAATVTIRQTAVVLLPSAVVWRIALITLLITLVTDARKLPDVRWKSENPMFVCVYLFIFGRAKAQTLFGRVMDRKCRTDEFLWFCPFTDKSFYCRLP